MAREKSLGEKIHQAYVDTRNHIEHRTIIPLIEGLFRIWYHLDPRIYSSRLRIRAVTQGHAPQKGNKFVLFVLYTRAGIPQFTQNVIDAIERSPFNLVVVTNSSLSGDVRAAVLDKCCLLIERANYGRDFGAYKDGLEILSQRYPDIERLVLLNDSLFFFERGLARIIAELDGRHDFIGLTEVFEYHYHVQSFMLSFSRNVLQHPRFTRFWRKYRPISTRRWSVHKGEVGLTRALTKAGFQPHILFHGAQLIEHLRGSPIEDLLSAIGLLPTFFRAQIYDRLEELQSRENAQATAPLAAASNIAQSLGVNDATDSSLNDIRNANIQQLRALTSRAITMDRWAVDSVWRQIVSTVTTRNQIHVGGFLFMRYLGLPIIKRDILYRTVYAIEDIYEILSEFNEPLRDEVIADLRRTGTVDHFGPIRRLLFRHGSI